MLRGNELVPIGAEKINNYFFKRLKTANRANMRAAVDPLQQIVIWAFPSVDSADGSNDELIIYNYFLEPMEPRGGELRCARSIVYGGLHARRSRQYQQQHRCVARVPRRWRFHGRDFFLRGRRKTKKVQSFTGTCLSATIDTGEFQVTAGRRSIVNTVIPYVTGGSVAPTISATIGSRALQHEDVTFGTASTVNSEGILPGARRRSFPSGAR